MGLLHLYTGNANPQPTVPQEEGQEDGQEAKEVQALTRGMQGGGDVCISGDANKWVHADPPSTWEAYGLQTAPEGYKLNKGAAYYPSEITTKDGNKRIANFVKVKWSNDPIICGKVQGDPAVYFNYLHTIPAGLPQPICTYTANKVALFKESHPLTKEVDNTVEWISDISLKAKLQCWRYKDTRLDYIQHEEDQLTTEKWKLQLTHGGTTNHLAGTDLKG